MINIYKILLKNEPVYIGQTQYPIEKRFWDHKSRAKTHNRPNNKLYNKFNKYGIENFTIELIEQVDNNFVDEREQYWIQFHDTINNGCNLAIGGRTNRGYKHSDEVRKNESIAAKKRYSKSGLAKWNGSKEQSLMLSKLYKNRNITWGDKISEAKSKGPYIIKLDGTKLTINYGLGKFAKEYNVSNPTLRWSLKYQKQCKSKGHIVEVRLA